MTDRRQSSWTSTCPGKNGYDVCRELKDDPGLTASQRKAVCTIETSGEDLHDDSDAGQRQLAAHLCQLSQSYDFAGLISVLQSAEEI